MAKIYGQNSKYLQDQYLNSRDNMEGYRKWILAFSALGVVVLIFGVIDAVINQVYSILIVGIVIVLICVVLDKFIKFYETRSAHFRQGQKGEWEVKVELSKLPENFALFCDAKLLGKKYNIDFLISGPTGIYAIEVKSFTGKVILENMYTQKAVRQVFTGAMKLREHLKLQTGKDVYIKAILVYSDDKVNVTTVTANHNVQILHKLKLNQFILSQKDISKQYNIFDFENHLRLLTGHNERY